MAQESKDSPVTSEKKRFHEIDGVEKFETNPRFKFTNYNQTIMHNKSLKIERTIRLRNCDHCVGSTKLDVLKKKIYYFEVRVDKIPSCATFIGISSSNIRNGVSYIQIPVIAAMNIHCGECFNINNYKIGNIPITKYSPPSVNETIGILVDFDSKEWNGAIRFFKNKQELMINGRPFIQNLLHSEIIENGYCYEKVPPISLYIGHHYTSKFKFTIKQFPFIPMKYKKIFPPYYTQKRKLEHIANTLENECEKRDFFESHVIYGNLIEGIRKILNISKCIQTHDQIGTFEFYRTNSLFINDYEI
eukprot:228074_1